MQGGLARKWNYVRWRKGDIALPGSYTACVRSLYLTDLGPQQFVLSFF